MHEEVASSCLQPLDHPEWIASPVIPLRQGQLNVQSDTPGDNQEQSGVSQTEVRETDISKHDLQNP
jgi:hypothetical protein